MSLPFINAQSPSIIMVFDIDAAMESIQRHAVWQDLGEAGRQARDEARGPKRYLRLSTGLRDPKRRGEGIDPAKVDPVSDWQVSGGQPIGGLFAAPFREDQKMPSDFVRKLEYLNREHQRFQNVRWNNLKGETFTLHPDTRHLYVNDFDQLRELYEKYGEQLQEAKTPQGAMPLERPSLNYASMAKDYDTIEFGPKMRHLAYMKAENAPEGSMVLHPNWRNRVGSDVPITDEERQKGNDLAKKYNLPMGYIDEMVVLNGYTQNGDSIFQDIQPYDMSTRRVKTNPEYDIDRRIKEMNESDGWRPI